MAGPEVATSMGRSGSITGMICALSPWAYMCCEFGATGTARTVLRVSQLASVVAATPVIKSWINLFILE